jgi:hypothetical protein
VKGTTVLFAYTLFICAKDGEAISNWIYLFCAYVPLVVEGCRKGNGNE